MEENRIKNSSDLMLDSVGTIGTVPTVASVSPPIDVRDLFSEQNLPPPCLATFDLRLLTRGCSPHSRRRISPRNFIEPDRDHGAAECVLVDRWLRPVRSELSRGYGRDGQEGGAIPWNRWRASRPPLSDGESAASAESGCDGVDRPSRDSANNKPATAAIADTHTTLISPRCHRLMVDMTHGLMRPLCIRGIAVRRWWIPMHRRVPVPR